VVVFLTQKNMTGSLHTGVLPTCLTAFVLYISNVMGCLLDIELYFSTDSMVKSFNLSQLDEVSGDLLSQF
jgi:hypothetical protein